MTTQVGAVAVVLAAATMSVGHAGAAGFTPLGEPCMVQELELHFVTQDPDGYWLAWGGGTRVRRMASSRSWACGSIRERPDGSM